MVNRLKVISSELDNLARRVIKFLKVKSDVRTALQIGPFGVDSNPIKDMIAIYAETNSNNERVVIGYINKNQAAEPGEHRIFSTDADGTLKTYVWLKRDGTIEVGGNTDFMVRYSKLAEAHNELKQDLENLKQAFNAWVVTPNDGGAALKAAAGSWAGTNFAKDIANAKIETIKTI